MLPPPRLVEVHGYLLKNYIAQHKKDIQVAQIRIRLRREQGLVQKVDWVRVFVKQPELAILAHNHFERFPLIRRLWMQHDITAVFMADTMAHFSRRLQVLGS